jgi:Ca2+-binding RTX toxin-like protein
MALLEIAAGTTSFVGDPIINITNINFVNPNATVGQGIFAPNQFNGTTISTAVQIQGSAGSNVIVVNGGSTDASGWTFIGTIEFISLAGGTGADTIRGSTQTETINGGDGDDIVIGSLGNDTLNGGGNTAIGDTLSYQFSNRFVTVNLATNTVSGGHAQGDTISNFENVTGSNLGDTLTGDGFANVLKGGDGADTLVGGGGQDTFEYNVASDIDAGESLDGGTGSNILFINGAASFNFTNVAISNVSVLKFSVAQSNVTLNAVDFSAGHINTLQGDISTNTINVVGTAINLSGLVAFSNWTAGVDLINLTGTAAADAITGSQQNDRITGGLGLDVLNGGSGEDTYFINAAAELVAGESYVDPGGNAETNRITMAGAGLFDFTAVTLTGIDVLDFSTASSTVRILGSQLGTLVPQVKEFNGTAAIDFLVVEGDGVGTSAAFTNWTDGVDIITINANGTESQVQGSLLSDIINGTAGHNVLQGNAGNDVLNGNGGDDSYFGGLGNDTINGGAGVDIATGQEGNDTLNGFGGNDLLNGGNNNDSIDGGADADQMFGEEGDDTLVVSLGSDLVAGDTFNGGNGIDSLRVTAVDVFDFTVATLLNLERLVFDAGGNATAHFLNTQIGNDGLDLSGLSVIEGNAGENFISIDATLGGITNLSGLSFVNWDSAFDRITIVGTGPGRTMIGSSEADTFLVTSGSNTLAGNAGDDIFISGDGADNINGGAGLNDLVNYSGSNAFVVASLSGGTVTGGLATGDVLTGIENLIGSSFGDTLVGSAGVNILKGNGGEDTLNGGKGNDQLLGGFDNDSLTGGIGGDLLDGGSGIDTALYLQSATRVIINLDTHFTGTGAAGDTLVSIENITGTQFDDIMTGDIANNTFLGGTGIDTLSGGLGIDILDGGFGDDVLTGGAGADQINGGAGSHDRASYAGSNLGVTVNLTTGINSGGHALDDILVSVEDLFGSSFGDQFTGDLHANKLEGRDSADVLDGQGGGDILDGGTGFDTASYQSSTSGVQIDLLAGTATGGQAAGDTLVSIENLTGSNSADSLTGNTIANVLRGGGGIDTLSGGAGSDTLEGGTGNDIMDGGLGADRFEFKTLLFGKDIINGFADGGDKLDFSSLGLGLADFTVTDAGADALITLNSDPTQTIRLSNFDHLLVNATDFL